MTHSWHAGADALIIPIIHLITRIYLAYRLCTKHIYPPLSFRVNQGRLVPVSLSLVCDPPPVHFATFSISQKIYIIKLLLTPRAHRGSFACTLYIMYHQSCHFCPFCTNTSYVTPDFRTIHFDDWTPFIFPSPYARWLLSLSLVIMRVSTLGVGVLFHSGLNCVIN